MTMKQIVVIIAVLCIVVGILSAQSRKDEAYFQQQLIVLTHQADSLLTLPQLPTSLATYRHLAYKLIDELQNVISKSSQVYRGGRYVYFYIDRDYFFSSDLHALNVQICSLHVAWKKLIQRAGKV